MNLLGLGRKKTPDNEFLDLFQELCDQAELAEEPDEHKAINKSILSLVGDHLETIDKAAKRRKRRVAEEPEDVEGPEEEEGDDELGDDADIQDDGDFGDEGDDDEGEGDAELEARIEAAKKAARKKVKIRKGITAYAPETEFSDAEPVLNMIGSALSESTAMIRKSAARTSRLEGRLDELASNLSPLLDFVEEARRGGVPTPQGLSSAGEGVLHKSLSLPTGAAPAFSGSADSEETLRGLNAVQLIKGVYQFLGSNPADDQGIGASDIDQIGKVPMSELNPKIAEIAAKELGVELEEK